MPDWTGAPHREGIAELPPCLGRAARLPVVAESLRPGMVVADVVFSPAQTHFLKTAAARGCTVVDGLGMLVNQGVIGIRHWTGVSPDVGAMRRALEQALA